MVALTWVTLWITGEHGAENRKWDIRKSQKDVCSGVRRSVRCGGTCFPCVGSAGVVASAELAAWRDDHAVIAVARQVGKRTYGGRVITEDDVRIGGRPGLVHFRPPDNRPTDLQGL